jgi:hypothetical protein
MAATVEESTPPDMATAMVFGSGIGHQASGFRSSCQLSARNLFWRTKLRADGCSIVNRGELAEAGYGLRDEGEDEFNVIGRVLFSQAEAEAGAGYLWRQAHGCQHVGRLNGS